MTRMHDFMVRWQQDIMEHNNYNLASPQSWDFGLEVLSGLDQMNSTTYLCYLSIFLPVWYRHDMLPLGWCC
jgi:hypothetical protein